ncbi:MAG: tetratricopeptide repeat protein [Alphaproteobacteria bacterium]
MSHSPFERLFNKAIEYQAKGMFEKAVTAWRAMLLSQPDYLPALNNLGIALRHLDRIAESEAVLRTGIERHPDSADLHISLGQTLQSWGLNDAAIEALKTAISLNPANTAAHYDLGVLYLGRGETASAEAALQSVLALDPAHALALAALADIKKAAGDVISAIDLYSRAHAAAPDNPSIETRLGIALLASGDRAAGLPHYDARWRTGLLPMADPGCPLWEGGPLDGRTLLVRCEQGLGMSLQFVRLLKLILDAEESGGRIVLECQPELVEILNSARWLDTVVAESDTPPEADVWSPLGSLLRLMGSRLLGEDLSSVGNPVPYLRPDAATLAPWRQKLPKDGLVIGIAWSGGMPLLQTARNAIPLRAFAPLAALPGVTLVSLQKGEGRREISTCGFPVVDFDTELDAYGGAFVDSAALISALPLVISADTPIAHLAGALGKPVWTALSPSPDWIWGLEGEDTCWYPSMTLFRRARGNDWTDVFSAMAAHLEQMRAMAGRPPGGS